MPDSNRQTTLNELVQKIDKILGKKIEPIYETPRSGDIKHSFASIKAAAKNLSYKLLVDSDSGLQATINMVQIPHEIVK